jgi:ADP-glucose pyrophosphorylase
MSTSDYLKSQLVKVVLSIDQSINEEIKRNFDKAEEAFRKAKSDIEEVRYNYNVITVGQALYDNNYLQMIRYNYSRRRIM